MEIPGQISAEIDSHDAMHEALIKIDLQKWQKDFQSGHAQELPRHADVKPGAGT